MKKQILKLSLLAVTSIGLSGCGTIGKIGDIGSAPDLAPIDNERVVPQYAQARPIGVAATPAVMTEQHQSNSLWKTGSRYFFKDARASKVGDILTVNITIDDQATIDNATTRTRSNAEDANLNKMLGLETLIPNSLTPGDLVNTTSTTSN